MGFAFGIGRLKGYGWPTDIFFANNFGSVVAHFVVFFVSTKRLLAYFLAVFSVLGQSYAMPPVGLHFFLGLGVAWWLYGFEPAWWPPTGDGFRPFHGLCFAAGAKQWVVSHQVARRCLWRWLGGQLLAPPGFMPTQINFTFN